MLKTLLLAFLFFTFTNIKAQEAKMVDSLRKEMGKTNNIESKVRLLGQISRITMNVDLQLADKYGKEAIQLAETSRDRKAMIIAYVSNAVRLGELGDFKEEYAERSSTYFEKAKKIAKENKLTEYEIKVLYNQSEVSLSNAKTEQAGKYIEQAITLSSALNNDSLKVKIALLKGNIKLAKNEKLEALRSYLGALRIAERLDKVELKRIAYQQLAIFYSSIEDYDKALDYRNLAAIELSKSKSSNARYQKITDLKAIGDLYAAKKNFDIAINTYNESIALADSLNFPTLKINGYVGLINIYILMKEPSKTLEFLNSARGNEVKKYMAGLNYSPFIDQIYAITYSEMGKLDSAQKYFDLYDPYYKNSQSVQVKSSGLLQSGNFYKRKGDYNKAIGLLLQARALADSTDQLEMALETSKDLDTLYERIGDYKQSKFYSAVYFKYKDSLQTLNKEKELSQIEAQDEQLRQEKLVQEAADKKRQRNNIQYLGITIGIASIFLLLIFLGMFKVSARFIKMLGFFAFLMFFEFIFLIFKKNVNSITHGEPWKDLLFMILLAAVLLPLHHWVEHKVLHFLTSQNKLTSAGDSFKDKLNRFKSKKEVSV